jgi:cbb3-type cytochrome oxidase maturation protein
MSVLFLVLPLAVIIAAAGVAAFAWAAKHGQFDDLDTPAMRVVMDDDMQTPAREEPHKALPTSQSPTTS